MDAFSFSDSLKALLRFLEIAFLISVPFSISSFKLLILILPIYSLSLCYVSCTTFDSFQYQLSRPCSMQ